MMRLSSFRGSRVSREIQIEEEGEEEERGPKEKLALNLLRSQQTQSEKTELAYSKPVELKTHAEFHRDYHA